MTPYLRVRSTPPRWTIQGADRPVDLVQLQVNQHLLDFAGYSGSPVIDAQDRVIGVLVEQVLTRLHDRANTAANVLYAVPMGDVMSVAELDIHAETVQQEQSLPPLTTPSPSAAAAASRWSRTTAPFGHPVGELISHLAVDRAGRLLATACSDGKVRIWDLELDEQVAALGHQSPVAGLAFSDDGRFIATALTTTSPCGAWTSR
jgi:WD40 repeat protein